jgi:FkbM family methyltransferase
MQHSYEGPSIGTPCRDSTSGSSSVSTPGSSLYLFGAGGAASWVLQGFRRVGIPIAGFLDDNADGIGAVAGLPVMRPDSPNADGGRRAESTVVLAVMNPAVDESALGIRLAELGWGTVQSLAEFGRSELSRSGRCCGMLDPCALADRTSELDAARALLADAHSQLVFDAFLAFCHGLDDSGFPDITPSPYFPEDLPRWPQPLRMVDCGAFDGDTLRAAKRHGYEFEACAAFEPDPVNFAKLGSTVRSLPGGMAWPCGVSDRTQLLRFSAQGDTGSSVCESGELAIQCVSLDDTIPHFAPNLIKLDIEGSEQAALEGARQLIKSSRPGLAVSVYHLSTDIWRIPLLLSEMLGPRCSFFLRRHSRTIADTVLYVYPDA